MKINKVLFTENFLSSINKIIDEHLLKTEVGGCLVGYQIDDNLVVTHASHAGENAKMTYRSIKIDGEYTTQFCNHLNEQSNYKLYFLGDWHTHLSDNLSPSNTDLNAMKDLAKYTPKEYRDTIITIILNHFEPLNVKVYCLENQKRLVTIDYSTISNPDWIEEFI